MPLLARCGVQLKREEAGESGDASSSDDSGSDDSDDSGSDSDSVNDAASESNAQAAGVPVVASGAGGAGAGTSDGVAAAQSLESGGSGVSDTDGNDDESSDGVSSQRGAWTAAPDNTARVAVRNRVYVLHSQWYCPLYSLCVLGLAAVAVRP